MTVNLISVADVKAFLPIRSTNTGYDAKITGLIRAASSQIEKTCRQTFAKSLRTEFHTSRLTFKTDYDFGGWSETATRTSVSEQAILLRASPLDIEAGVKVWYDPARKFSEQDLLPEDDVFVDPDASLSRLLITHPTINRQYAFKVEYTAGFDVADDSLSAALEEHAADLKQACIETVLNMFNSTSDTEAAEDKDQTSRCIIPKSALALLSPYKRVLTGRG